MKRRRGDSAQLFKALIDSPTHIPVDSTPQLFIVCTCAFALQPICLAYFRSESGVSRCSAVVGRRMAMLTASSNKLVCQAIILLSGSSESYILHSKMFILQPMCLGPPSAFYFSCRPHDPGILPMPGTHQLIRMNNLWAIYMTNTSILKLSIEYSGMLALWHSTHVNNSYWSIAPFARDDMPLTLCDKPQGSSIALPQCVHFPLLSRRVKP